MKVGRELIGYLFLFSGIFTWSTIELTVKLIQDTGAPINGLTVNFVRLVFGSIILILYISITSGIRRLIRFIRTYPMYILPAAFFGMYLGQIIYLTGVSMTSASYSATIFSANPIIIGIFGMLFFNEEVTIRKITGIILGFFGVVIIVTELDFAELLNSSNLLGNLLVFIGMCLWCSDIILGKALMLKARRTGGHRGDESENFNALTFAIASLIMLPQILLGGGLEPLASYTPAAWSGLLYLGIITGGLGYVLFFKGIDLTEASRGINIFYFKPIIATILAFILRAEVPGIYLYAGLIIETISLILVSGGNPAESNIIKEKEVIDKVPPQ